MAARKEGIPILISLDAKTATDGQPEDVMRLITTGELVERADETLIRYDENLDEQEPPQHIELAIRKDGVTMTRKGSINANMVFQKAKRYESQYHTPYGVLDMALYCIRADYTQSSTGGELALVYQLDLGGNYAAMHDMRLHWMRKKKLMGVLPQEELTALLGAEGFVRRMNSEEALFVTDAPRRLSAVERETIKQRLAFSGFVCSDTANGLWAIDLSAKRYQAILESYPIQLPVPFPPDDALLPVYTLVRLLILHPSEPAQQPRGLLLSILKAADQPGMVQKLAPDWQARCAQLLRQHQALPYSAAGLLQSILNTIGKGR